MPSTSWLWSASLRRMILAVHFVALVGVATASTKTLNLRFANAIDVRGRTKQWKQAVRLFRAMKEPDEHSRAVAISACGKAGAWEAAVSLLSPSAGVGAYNAAIMACGRSGEMDAALEVLERMANASVAPTTLTYTTAITACGKTKSWQTALALLEDLESRGLEPTSSVHNAAMLVCDRANQWQAAVQLLDEMRVRGTINQASVNTAVRACNRCGQFEQAQLVWAEGVDRAHGTGAPAARRDATAASHQPSPSLHHLSHFSGLRRVDRQRTAGRSLASRTHWALGAFTSAEIALDVALAPDRAAGRNYLKLFFLERRTGRKVALILLENTLENTSEQRADDVPSSSGGTSALRGLRIEEEWRGKGLSKVLVGIWLRLCLHAGVTPRAARINKPLLAHTLERRFHFGAEGGVTVRVSNANRRRDCIVERGGGTQAVHVHTGFTAPPLEALERAVAEAIGTNSLAIEPDCEALTRAFVGKILV